MDEHNLVTIPLRICLRFGYELHNVWDQMTGRAYPDRDLNALHLAVGAVATICEEMHLAVMDVARQGRVFAVESITRHIIEGKVLLCRLLNGGVDEAEKYIATVYLKLLRFTRDIKKIKGWKSDPDLQHLLTLFESTQKRMEMAIPQHRRQEANQYDRPHIPQQGTKDYILWSEFSDATHLGALHAAHVLLNTLSNSGDAYVFRSRPDYLWSARALDIANLEYLQILRVFNEVFACGLNYEIERLSRAWKRLINRWRGLSEGDLSEGNE